jgi:hypothetical protein
MMGYRIAQLVAGLILLTIAIYGFMGFEYYFPSRHFGRPILASGSSAYWIAFSSLCGALASFLSGAGLSKKSAWSQYLNSALILLAIVLLGVGFITA